MNTTSIVRNVPLDRLVLSPSNVRKSPASAAEDAELKASIRAGGLKQNLIVYPVVDKRSASPSRTAAQAAAGACCRGRDRSRLRRAVPRRGT